MWSEALEFSHAYDTSVMPMTLRSPLGHFGHAKTFSKQTAGNDLLLTFAGVVVSDVLHGVPHNLKVKTGLNLFGPETFDKI